MPNFSRRYVKEIFDLVASDPETLAKPDVVKRVVALIKEAYADASKEELEEVSHAFRLAFRMDDAEIAKLFGVQRERLPSVPVTATPASLSSIVTQGWFHRYLEYTEASEPPGEFHFGAVLACCSAALGRRPLLGWEARKTYPNLYVLLVGPTGARKGAAMELARLLVGEAAPDTHFLADEGTHQGYAEALRRRYQKTGRWSDGLIVSDEFSVLISQDKNKLDLVKWLTDLYDCKDVWKRALRSEEEEYELRNLYVCVLGGSNMAWLRTMPSDAITGGFMPRFVLFPADDKKDWIAFPRYNERLRMELLTRLRTTLTAIPDRMEFDESATKHMQNWYEVTIRQQYDASADDQFRAWLARKQAAAMKIAVVWQLVDNGPRDKVTVEWMSRACALVDWCDRPVLQIYNALGVTQEAEAVEMVFRFIQRRDGTASQKSIIRGLRNKLRRARILEALSTLQHSGMVEAAANPVQGIVWKSTGMD